MLLGTSPRLLLLDLKPLSQGTSLEVYVTLRFHGLWELWRPYQQSHYRTILFSQPTQDQ